MKSEYEPRDVMAALGYLVEECGEVMHAAGKTLRWGLESVNPELPLVQQETNRAWLLREMRDVEGAIRRVRLFLAAPAEANPEPRCTGNRGRAFEDDDVCDDYACPRHSLPGSLSEPKPAIAAEGLKE